MRHPFSKQVADLRAEAVRVELGEPTPAGAALLLTAADLVEKYGGLLVRFKAAAGPSLVAAARIEAEGAEGAEGEIV